MSLTRQLLIMAARQRAARADYHDRTKDSRGEFRKLGHHAEPGLSLGNGVACGCEECSP